MKQHTLAEAVGIEGIGLHSGLASRILLQPAPAGHGIVFERTDLPEHPRFPALYSQIVDTRNCSCLGDDKHNVVSTIEHLMSVLAVRQIDNLLIGVSNAELPIMDGSAKVFDDILRQVPLCEQAEERRFLRVKKTVVFTDDKGNQVSLKPFAAGLKINFSIDFPSKIVGHQSFSGVITSELFAQKIAPCRTFCEKYQVDYLQSIGLIKGGSLDNALVLDDDHVVNDGGFRTDNECVNHKVLDAIGDLYTAGYPILGELTADKTGHYHNNELLKLLFSDATNYELV